MSGRDKPPAARLPGLEWRPEYETGNASIDHEHQQIIRLLNQLFAALQENAGPAPVLESLAQVLAGISAHFALEETIMRQRNYDHYGEHKASHERLLDEIRDIMDDFELGFFSGLNAQLRKRLEDWFVEHFKSMDARLHRRLDSR